VPVKSTVLENEKVHQRGKGGMGRIELRRSSKSVEPYREPVVDMPGGKWRWNDSKKARKTP
jgi:hypothetical protein